MVQATLFEVLEAPRNQREARFLAFHQANPIVYKLWDKFTREALATRPQACRRCLDHGAHPLGDKHRTGRCQARWRHAEN
jgi:hypothetical protein